MHSQSQSLRTNGGGEQITNVNRKNSPLITNRCITNEQKKLWNDLIQLTEICSTKSGIGGERGYGNATHDTKYNNILANLYCK